MRSTHSQRLERWLGREAVESLSRSARGWYGDPIPVANVPGLVYATGDGDFVGLIRGGFHASAADFVAQRIKRISRNFTAKQLRTANTGFASLGDLISEATAGGKRQDNWYVKGATTAAATNQTCWPLGSFPAAGSAGSNIPGGSVPTNATAGSLAQTDPSGSDTLHVTTVQSVSNVASQTLLLYDRLFHAANILHTTTGNQAVSGTPTRYTGTASANSFITLEVTSTLGSTAHNATITYVDDQGNTAEAGSAQAVTASSVANRLPFASWFYVLNSPDKGARNATNIAFSAVSSGTSQIVQGMPIMFIPQPVANAMVVMDGINSAFNLKEIKTGACLTFMSLQGTATATTYTGMIVLVAG